MKDITIWLTYHDDRQIQEYTLEETKEIRLFKGNDISVQGEHINHLNKFYSEMTTMYYVWKNRIVSTKVGFCHYRRRFVDYFDVEEGQCQVLAINYGLPVFQHYKSAHNFQDLYDVVDILNDQYGVNNKYSCYLLQGTVFIPFCCFIMQYSDFERLCCFLFPILFAWDRKHGLDMNPENYLAKARKDFRHDSIDYQCRAIGFLAERLISCYIVTEMQPFCVNTLYK